MIDGTVLLADTRKLADQLVDDLRARTDSHEDSRIHVQGVYGQAVAAGRTDKTFEEWREDLLAQVAAAWVLGCVFVRFCEDNGLYDVPLLSGPGERLGLARDHRSAFFAREPAADDRDWLREVFGRYAVLPGVSGIFGERNPLWQLSPGPDGARALVELWWTFDDEGRVLRHDFTDETLDTRFLGDLYENLSEHVRKLFALLQTPKFVEEFILNRTLEPAIEAFGLAETRMIDPTCGSGHFLLGAFERLLERWRQAEPGTDVRELAQRALDAVNGVDINPFAVAIARFRLLVAALQASAIHRLTDAPFFHIHVAAGDSLLHGTSAQLTLESDASDPLASHRYPSEDGELANRLLRAGTYHCVVANPPYIIVRDRALNEAYRLRYSSCHRKYSLGVPFTERCLSLAVLGTPMRGGGGFVGIITANSFTKRELGVKLIEQTLPKFDLTHIVDTSGAYIPGHGTPTVILFIRNQSPQSANVRMALGIQGEAGIPNPPEMGAVWQSLLKALDQPGYEDSYFSIVDRPRASLKAHPWTLRGGAAQDVQLLVEGAPLRFSDFVEDMGIGAISGADDQFTLPGDVVRRYRLESTLLRPVVDGQVVRDWGVSWRDWAVFPYEDGELSEISNFEQVHRLFWPRRTTLGSRATFSNMTYREEGRPWWEWHQVVHRRASASRSIHLAEIATHNHFALFDGQHIGKQTAPIAIPKSSLSDDQVAGLIAVMNSSVLCFWLKEVCYPKGGDQVGSAGARVRKTLWDEHYSFNTTNVLEAPISRELPVTLGRELISLSTELLDCWNVFHHSEIDSQPPTPAVLEHARIATLRIRARAAALQEELDWACYHRYGLIDEELTLEIDELPPLEKGERAFEIALARKMAAGATTSAWFDRHDSTPITDLPDLWNDRYRHVVERRLELIASDRAIGLLERPEYKRRWNWAEMQELVESVQRAWLLDRIEALLSDGAAEPEVTTIARLADRLWQDSDARAVSEDLEGAGADPVSAVGQLVASAGVPYLAALRLKESGLVKRRAWERTWDLQRTEDSLNAQSALTADDPDYLDSDGLRIAKAEASVERMAPPPNFSSSDFRGQSSWRLRGKLDVPKERFILYPGTHAGADTTMVVAWAGWDHLQQLRALAGLYTARKQDGAEVGELTPMLAGMMELLPWVLQWHDEPDPVFGDRMGQYFTGFFDTERSALGLTVEDLAGWRP